MKHTHNQPHAHAVYVAWEDEFTHHIEIMLDCDRSDAQGVVEASEETVKQLFEQGFTPEDAAIEFSTMQRDF
jgi:hypothetical protein